ncbi:hypothetical protein BGW42_003516 [Actinomortierella wolfii]|nr:hypothetical protein BGW42_003516 [Actinomortierella wolfii]
MTLGTSSSIPLLIMKAFVLLAILAVYASADHYIIDVHHHSDNSITFFGNLRYVYGDYSPKYQDCKAKMGIWVQRGFPGGISVCNETRLALGLYFPNGFNGTISEAYDYHNKLTYPCIPIDETDIVTTYACRNILTIDLYPDGPYV